MPPVTPDFYSVVHAGEVADYAKLLTDFVEALRDYMEGDIEPHVLAGALYDLRKSPVCPDDDSELFGSTFDSVIRVCDY